MATSLHDAIRANTHFTLQSNDLYHFYHTDQFTGALDEWKQFITSLEFNTFVSDVTGLELYPGEWVDANMQRYDTGHYLLCHDDDIQGNKSGRRVAFILYLVDEDWTETDGGTLDLYGHDQEGWPTRVETSLVPRSNMLAFFPVTADSFHQVSMIRRNSRFSLSGWLHGPVQDYTRCVWKQTQVEPQVLTEEIKLEDWIHPEWMGTMEHVKEAFIDTSCMELRQFLRQDVYERLQQSDTSGFEHVGPPNVRHYKERRGGGDDALSACQRFLQSKVFARWLEQVTTLTVTGVHPSLRLYEPASYQLLRDDFNEPFGLDVVFYMVKQDVVDGRTIYVEEGEADPLIESHIHHNTLRVVWRRQGVRRFIRFAQDGTRLELSGIYTVQEELE
jgi:hypothetical protein